MVGGPKGCYCIFWSPQYHCSVPQIPFIVPRKQLFCPLKFQIICRPPKIIVLSPQIPFLVALKIILSPQKWTAPQSYQSCSEKSEARWPFVYICHKTVNKALNDEEIVYFGTILMIKTCFGTKLMIKPWFTHFLSLVQFVAIYVLLGGPTLTKNSR